MDNLDTVQSVFKNEVYSSLSMFIVDVDVRQHRLLQLLQVINWFH